MHDAVPLLADTFDLVGGKQLCWELAYAYAVTTPSCSIWHQTDDLQLVQMAAFGDPLAALKWVEQQPFLPDIVFLGMSHSPDRPCSVCAWLATTIIDLYICLSCAVYTVLHISHQLPPGLALDPFKIGTTAHSDRAFKI